jgi:hypothetical protein
VTELCGNFSNILHGRLVTFVFLSDLIAIAIKFFIPAAKKGLFFHTTKTISARNPENILIPYQIFLLKCILKATDERALQKLTDSNKSA